MSAGSSVSSGNSGYQPGEQVGYARSVMTTTDSTALVIPYDTTIPQNTEGKALPLLSVTYTPRFANSKLRVRGVVPYGCLTSNVYVALAMFRDAVANALNTWVEVRSVSNGAGNIVFDLEVPANAAGVATTFNFRYGVNAGTAYINGNGGTMMPMQAFAEVTEIKQ